MESVKLFTCSNLDVLYTKHICNLQSIFWDKRISTCLACSSATATRSYLTHCDDSIWPYYGGLLENGILYRKLKSYRLPKLHANFKKLARASTRLSAAASVGIIMYLRLSAPGGMTAPTNFFLSLSLHLPLLQQTEFCHRCRRSHLHFFRATKNKCLSWLSQQNIKSCTPRTF